MPTNTYAPIQAILSGLLRDKQPADQIVIGIAGGSGSGKTSVAESIRAGLRSCSVELIGLDRFFKPVDELPRYWSAYHGEARANFNHPESLRVEEMTAFCAGMRGFDVVLLDGHFCLYYAPMRQLMDIRCFVDIRIEEMLERRKLRNLAVGYGGTAEEIDHYNQECVAPQYFEHLLPTRQEADLVIPNNDDSSQERDALIRILCEEILKKKGR